MISIDHAVRHLPFSLALKAGIALQLQMDLIRLINKPAACSGKMTA